VAVAAAVDAAIQRYSDTGGLEWRWRRYDWLFYAGGFAEGGLLAGGGFYGVGRGGSPALPGEELVALAAHGVVGAADAPRGADGVVGGVKVADGGEAGGGVGSLVGAFEGKGELVEAPVAPDFSVASAKDTNRVSDEVAESTIFLKASSIISACVA